MKFGVILLFNTDTHIHTSFSAKCFQEVPECLKRCVLWIEELLTSFPVFGSQGGIFYCSGIFFSLTLEIPFSLVCGVGGFFVLLTTDSSCWRLGTHAVIISATLLLLSHKQEESLVLLLSFWQGCKGLDSGHWEGVVHIHLFWCLADKK